MAECRIEVITYEQSRLEYFKELQNKQKKRLEQFEKSSAIKELPPQERHYQLSKMGEFLQYYDDIVKMLEDCTRTPKEGDKMSIQGIYCEGSQCKKRDKCALHCVEPGDYEYIDWSTYGGGHAWSNEKYTHVETWCDCGDEGEYKKFEEVQV